MDLIKIGKYIAGKRKALGMTQRQLAEKLGMSDKSVSKWERGICLPDVSVYSELCLILGISINEFLAGEDIARDNIIQKSEENIIGVATDSKHKQKRLKIIIGILLIISVITVSVIGRIIYQEKRPYNFIAPVSPDSIEMQTAELFAGMDGVFLYQFTTTDEYKRIRLGIHEYQSGELIGDVQKMELGFEGCTESPKNGEILLLPDFENFVIKIVISADGSKFTTEYPILENVPDREYYARSATDIREATDIRYDEEQPLVAFIYDNDEMAVINIEEMMGGDVNSLGMDDFVYGFSVEFCK